MDEVANKNDTITNLTNELTKTRIELTITEKNLNDIKRLNLKSKVKLQVLLFLDSTRFFLPNFLQNALNTFETSLFVTNISNSSY